jgi:threonine synthase
MGYPIEEIIAVQNSNCPIVDYIKSGYIWNKKRVTTLTPSMDILKPTGLPRLKALFPSWEELNENVHAFSATDVEIKREIARHYEKTKEILSPQTALACSAFSSVDLGVWGIIGVTHPAKYAELTQSLIGATAPSSDRFAEQLSQPAHALQVSAELDSLSDIVLDFCVEMEIAC